MTNHKKAGAQFTSPSYQSFRLLKEAKKNQTLFFSKWILSSSEPLSALNLIRLNVFSRIT